MSACTIAGVGDDLIGIEGKKGLYLAAVMGIFVGQTVIDWATKPKAAPWGIDDGHGHGHGDHAEEEEPAEAEPKYGGAYAK